MTILSVVDLAILCVLVALVAMVLVGLLQFRRWVARLDVELRALRSEVRDTAQESINIASLSALNFSFPVVFGGPSIDGHHARLLLHLLQEHRPKRILELGSGSSSTLIAKALVGLKIPAEWHVAVDHDPKFLSIARDLAALNGVAPFVRFECCPLAPLPGYSSPWYSGVPALVGEGLIDLVVVDGPPAYEKGRELAREPALEILRPFLAPGAVIVLDDANRPGEREVVKHWQQRYPDLAPQWIREGKGVAVLRCQ